MSSFEPFGDFLPPGSSWVWQGPPSGLPGDRGFFRSVLLLPGTFTLLPGTIKRSRILPCGKGPHFYLVCTSLPWIHFCLVCSKVYHLYLLSWPFVKGARKSFSHRSHSFSVVVFIFPRCTFSLRLGIWLLSCGRHKPALHCTRLKKSASRIVIALSGVSSSVNNPLMQVISQSGSNHFSVGRWDRFAINEVQQACLSNSSFSRKPPPFEQWCFWIFVWI